MTFAIYIASLAILFFVCLIAMDISRISKLLGEIKRLLEEGADNA